MFGFVGGDVADGREDVGGVSASTLNAITMVDPSFSSFMVDIKVLEVVVKVDGACAKISAEEGGVGGEDSGDVDATFSAERKCNTC